jgi:signal transduction histidine kinase
LANPQGLRAAGSRDSGGGVFHPSNHSATGGRAHWPGRQKGVRTRAEILQKVHLNNDVLARDPSEPVGDPAQLLDALHALRVAVTMFDSGGRLRFANAHLNHFFRGLPPYHELIGRSYAEIIRLELPEIAPAALKDGVEAFIDLRLGQLAPRAWAPLDVALADGRVLEIKARRDGHGGAILLWNDVTRERHQFARLEEAIRLSADAFCFYDARDNFITGNELYAQLAGKPLVALRGQPFETIIREILHSGRLKIGGTPEEWLTRRLRGHRQQRSADTLETADGKAFLVRDCATPDGGRAVVFTDITEKTRAEDALAQTQRALEHTRDEAARQTGYLSDLTKRLDLASAQADNAKTVLLRTMSHELKTPLNAILGFSDLMTTLADNLGPDQVREYAGLIHQGGTNLFKMLNQIMDLTKISAGRYDLQKLAVDTGGLLWLARENFVARAAAKDITINADACPIGLMAAADESVLTGMLNALIDNAVTFTQKGGTIELSATRDGASVHLAVSDNGPGVAAADLGRILQPFEHAGRVADHAKGAGLGLTLVKAFAELHGGRLLVDSHAGEGFKAVIVLPAD